MNSVARGRIFCFFIVLLFFVTPAARAQVRCGTDENEIRRHLLNPKLEKAEAFERWMNNKLSRGKGRLNQLSGGREEEVTYTIPVVFHIVHNGEAVGVGTNLSDAQIASQIDALNRDYPRLNPDSVNTPAEFRSAAGKINMKFVLAKQNPEGLPSNGITRDRGSKTLFVYPDDESIYKSYSYWPAEDYLNVWVINFEDPGHGTIAYSELPVSSLPGLEDSPNDRLIDGVVVLYTCVGDNSNGANYNLNAHFNKGRTLTHEFGHIFGLRHIWGDVTMSCSGTDYCSDTPPQSGPNYNCPVQPSQTCSVDMMFQNYMDYTDDDCYNLFTKDQIARMVVVLGNSPRRASLLVSKGALDPTVPPEDLGVRAVVYPEVTACRNLPVIPSVQIRNYGNAKITTAKIQFLLNGATTETKDFNLDLNYQDTTNVSFSPVSFAFSSTIQFKVISINGDPDTVTTNNLIAQPVNVPASVAIPFIQTFDSTPSSWLIVNPDSAITWANKTAPYTSATNKSMYMDFYDYQSRGQHDFLISPDADLSGLDVATLKFDWSYALESTDNPDQLRVVLSTTCDSKNSVELFNAAGTSLATATATTTAFTPKSASDWRTQSISLTPYLGNPHIQIRFIGTNQYGNNLYVDNVSITSEAYSDLAIISLKSPAPVTCLDSPVPTIQLVNYGSIPVNGFTVSTTINNGTIKTQAFPDLSLAVGQDTLLALNAWALNSGANTIKITATEAGTDIAPTNNTITVNQVVNTDVKTIPLRQDFEGAFTDWSIVNPTQGENWKSVTTASYGNSLYYNSFADPALGNQSWLVSPVLKMNGQTASVFFDVSYAQSQKGDDRLQVLASEDCGKTFSTVLYDKHSSELSVGYANGSGVLKTEAAWVPQSTTQWKREYINLDAFAGNQEARYAFVTTNGNGNNLYLDNIEFFISDNQFPLAVEPLYAVYNNMTSVIKVTFNLPNPTPVRMQVINLLGQVITDSQLPDVLNQTYTISLDGAAPGVYIVRLQMGSKLGSAKVIVGG